MFGLWKKKDNRGDAEDDEEEEDEDEYEEEESERTYTESDYDPRARSRKRVFAASLIASEPEKSSVLKMFTELRNESSFCDVAFLCQGVMFRAHRVIVSSWSRWLRAILCQADDEVISLDVFNADAFGKILDYMYGSQLSIGLENADDIIKAVRRLEMHLLEQQCWRYLMTIIDAGNCEFLHELADRYDCPPLKLTAWRILEKSVPGYSTAPQLEYDDDDNPREKVLSNGFGAPGQMPVVESKNRYDDEYDDEEDDFDKYDDDYPHIFDPSYHDESDTASLRSDVAHPKLLSPTASAKTVVTAWSRRLQDVYEQCVPRDGDDYVEQEPFYGAFGDPRITLRRQEDLMRKHHRGRGGRRSKGVGEGEGEGEGESEGGDEARGDGESGRGTQDNTRPRRKRQGQGQGQGDEGNSVGTGRSAIDWHLELEKFYIAVNSPDKIDGIDKILATYEGREEEMMRSLMTKYRKQLSKDVRKRVEALLQAMETGTEASFAQSQTEQTKTSSSMFAFWRKDKDKDNN